MKEVCVSLTDPFGDDDVDFPIDMWLEEYVEKCAAFVEHSYNSCSELEAQQSALAGPIKDPVSSDQQRKQTLAWFKTRKLSRHDLDQTTEEMLLLGTDGRLVEKKGMGDRSVIPSPRMLAAAKRGGYNADDIQKMKEEEEEEEDDDD